MGSQLSPSRPAHVELARPVQQDISHLINGLQLVNLHIPLNSPVHVDLPVLHNRDVCDLVDKLQLSRCGQGEILVNLREDAVTSLLASSFHFRDVVPRVLGLLLVAQGLLLLFHPGVDAPGCTPTADGIHVTNEENAGKVSEDFP